MEPDALLLARLQFAFTLIGMAVLVPVILGYTVFVYHTFRGKICEGEGYH
jgi:cytochrome d ubiquinol oxidase subunit II